MFSIYRPMLSMLVLRPLNLLSISCMSCKRNFSSFSRRRLFSSDLDMMISVAFYMLVILVVTDAALRSTFIMRFLADLSTLKTSLNWLLQYSTRPSKLKICLSEFDSARLSSKSGSLDLAGETGVTGSKLKATCFWLCRGWGLLNLGGAPSLSLPLSSGLTNGLLFLCIKI